MSRALLEHFPNLESKLNWQSLGEFPSPVEPLAPLGDFAENAFIKRDDLSSPIYGGNKVRTLEVLFGEAKAAGAERIYSTGAYGSNHALATILHAERVGLGAGAILFPQPRSRTAKDNLQAMLTTDARIIRLPHWSFLPPAMWKVNRSAEPSYVMPPGGATALGALGYVSAAFELAAQVRKGELPSPRSITVGVGSTCTSAGLLLGLCIAHRRALGFDSRPLLRSVRVTPWPITAAFRITGLALRASALLSALTGDETLRVSKAELERGLLTDGSKLGRGYGKPTDAGRKAIEIFSHLDGLTLDTTYSGKSAAGYLEHLAGSEGPSLFWSTKSTAPLPAGMPARGSNPKLLDWLRDR